MVGAANSLIYALATVVYTECVGIGATIASGLGYATAVPLAYLGHRRLTFNARGEAGRQFVRFIVTHGVGFLLAIGVVWILTDVFEYPIWMGVSGAILAVPSVSYLVMDRWVFAR